VAQRVQRYVLLEGHLGQRALEHLADGIIADRLLRPFAWKQMRPAWLRFRPVPAKRRQQARTQEDETILALLAPRIWSSIRLLSMSPTRSWRASEIRSPAP
jgi:hypothetical protein